jgi:hypothetical protein
MTKFYPKIDGEVFTADFECFPKELENGWIFIHEFQDHKLLSHLFSMYKSNDFLRGTVIVSPYFYHKYPDIYSLYTKKTKDGKYLGSRIQINPIHRGKKWLMWYAYMTRVIFWGTFKKHVDVVAERTAKIENFYSKATKSINQDQYLKNDGRKDFPDEEMGRDLAHPYVWYHHRIGGKIEKEKNEI